MTSSSSMWTMRRQSWLTASKTADSWYPRFSPDGSKLAYISARILTYPDGTTRPSTYQVTLQDMKDLTRPPVALTTGEAYKLGPESVLEWSPDGSQILFSGERLYVMNADGTDVRPVGGTDYGRISNLTWLPGGNFALANEELLINLLTGDPMKFSFPYPVWYTTMDLPLRRDGPAAPARADLRRRLDEPLCRGDRHRDRRAGRPAQPRPGGGRQQLRGHLPDLSADTGEGDGWAGLRRRAGLLEGGVCADPRRLRLDRRG